jgi:putative peptidoglycan lipid II flippase
LFVPKMAHAGLALSVGLGACLNAVLLYVGLKRKGIYAARPGWNIFFLKLFAALTLMAGISLWIAGRFDWLALHAHPIKRIIILSIVIAISMAVYFGSLLAMGFRLKDFRRISN